MAKLTTMKNIGKELEKKIMSIDINQAEELRKLDSKEVYMRLKLKYPEICLVHLYTIEGAITNIEYNKLSEDKKRALKEFVDSFKI